MNINVHRLSSCSAVVARSAELGGKTRSEGDIVQSWLYEASPSSALKSRDKS